MQKNAATKIIKETFDNSFDKGRFIHFIRNLLNSIEEDTFIYRGKYITDAYGDYIKTLERVGKYKDPAGKKIDILIVNLRKETSLEHARTMQRNFIAWYLDGSRGKEQKEVALVAFVSPDGEDWRFSLVKMDYTLARSESGRIKTKKELTPARRWSFLVGEHENSHTAQKQLFPILENDGENPTLKQIEEAFSIEKVTKEFFEKYHDLFLRLEEALGEIIEKNVRAKTDFKEKSIDNADFCKKLLGQIVFLYFLQKKGWFGVARGKKWGEGDKQFLRHLFRRAQNEKKNYFNDYLEPLFYQALRHDRSTDDDYFSQFDCKIPFLNGGLFDPMNNYDWIDVDILLPDDIFSNDRKTKEGDIGDGILDIFDRYNFTVREDEPLEKEVAVDPEMLGKVFESLLEVKDRKSKGTYYTPREIVHYMCQESLANYLMTELEGRVSKEDTETLIKYGETVVEHDITYLERTNGNGKYKGRYDKAKLPDSICKNSKLIDEKLASIRVCDPAVGSGAFPVGMMNEIVRTRNALTPHIGKNSERTSYHFKREAIQSCLYGVDIDPGAVEIAKLRLWLSLVVDEEERENIQPLPNLDYKIIQGNSLLSVSKPHMSGTPDMFYEEKMKKLHDLKQFYFNETSASKKQEYHKQIDELISKITNGHKDFDFEVYFSEVFHEKKGFDVVIANPPYVSAWAMTKEDPKERSLIKQELNQYLFLSGHWDLYIAFVAKGHQILHSVASLAYIVPNPILREKYAAELRKYLLEKMTLKSVLAFNDVNVFENVSRRTTVLIALKTEPDDFYDIPILGNQEGEIILTNKVSSESWLNNPRHVFLISSNSVETEVLRKIENGSQKIGNFFYVNYGAQVSSKKKGLFGKKEVVIKKAIDDARSFFEGKDVHRWKLSYRNLWLDYRKDEIYGPRAPELFETEKLAIRKVSDRGHKIAAAIDQNGRYTDDGNVLVVPYSAVENTDLHSEFKGFEIRKGDLSLKYALAVLLSSLETFYFRRRFATESLQGATSHTYPASVRALLIKKISSREQKPFISLVDKILAITKDDDYLENPAKQAKVREYEKQIDQLVYKLYDLTPKEVKIIENGEKAEEESKE